MKYENNKIVYEAGDYCWSNSDECVYGISEIFNGENITVEHANKYPEFRRPATQEEISRATKEQPIMVGDYKVDFGNGARGEQLDFIKVGCVTVGRLGFLEIKEKAGW